MKLTSKKINQMPYTDFIALIKETNRCPGGKDTIRRIIQNTFVDRKSKVLEIGSNTGFTSLEIAHTVKCQVEGIDISKSCVNESLKKIDQDTSEIKKLVNFKVASAYEIPFSENSFDLVVTGGATSFMDNKSKAVKEYIRVVKPWGFISATQLFYIKKPPQKVINDVSHALGVQINPWSEKDWLKVFDDSELELYHYEKHELFSRSEDIINEYINYFLKKPHLSKLDENLKQTIKKKWKKYIDIFNENHRYLGYFIAIFRKNLIPEEPELFIRK